MNLTRILLIEDNLGDVLLTREAFAECNIPHELDVVEDGETAIRYLENVTAAKRPHLILLDINLPKQNGKEVLRFIKNHPSLKTIPVLVLTTSGSEHDIQEMYALHANTYIVKPTDLPTFLDVIKTIEHYWLHVACLGGYQR